jgi:rhodanese-related sulfurtransferase
LSYILIDLRPKALIEQGHIPKAVSLPKAGIDALKDQFPKYMNAAIILYNEDGDISKAQDVYKTILDWGYKNVTILAGGMRAWDKDGRQLAKGPADAKIAYVRKLAPGEVELAQFKDVITDPKGSVILDVRAVSEASDGSLPNALNIPLDELEKRLSDIPKDKVVYVYCGTGARAEMAYNVLKKAGVNSKYLKSKVEFDKENKGKYSIED